MCMLFSKIGNTVSRRTSFGTNLRETKNALEDVECLQNIDLRDWCSIYELEK